MTMSEQVYYIIFSNGVPQEVAREHAMALQRQRELSTPNRPATILPVVARTKSEPPLHLECTDEAFDLSDIKECCGACSDNCEIDNDPTQEIVL
jgi:hypothetical protein